MTKRITPETGQRILELCDEGVSYRQIAEDIDSTHTAVRNWLKRNTDKVASHAMHGQIEMLPPPDIRGNQRTQPKKNPPPVGTGNITMLVAKEKLRQLQLNNDAAERKLIPITDVEVTWGKKLGAIKTSLESMPARLKQRRPELTGDDIGAMRELLSEAIREMLAA